MWLPVASAAPAPCRTAGALVTPSVWVNLWALSLVITLIVLHFIYCTMYMTRNSSWCFCNNSNDLNLNWYSNCHATVDRQRWALPRRALRSCPRRRTRRRRRARPSWLQTTAPVPASCRRSLNQSTCSPRAATAARTRSWQRSTSFRSTWMEVHSCSRWASWKFS